MTDPVGQTVYLPLDLDPLPVVAALAKDWGQVILVRDPESGVCAARWRIICSYRMTVRD